jgi:hypothetical protein
MHCNATALPNLNLTRSAQEIRNCFIQIPASAEQSPTGSEIGMIEAGFSGCSKSDAELVFGREVLSMLQGMASSLDDGALSLEMLPCHEQDVVRTVQVFAADGSADAIAQAPVGSPAHDLLRQMQEHADTGDSGLTAHARSVAVLDFLGKLVNNEFQGDWARQGCNVALVSLRNGLIVGMSTVLRQLVGFEIERALYLHEQPYQSRELLAIAAMLLGPALNLAGALRDECVRSATLASRLSRVVLFALSIGSIFLVSQVGKPSLLGSGMAAIALQTNVYTLVRDLLQLLFPLQHNVVISAGGTVAGTATYSMAQFFAAEAMETFAPGSGPGRVRSAASALEDVVARTESSVLAWFAAKLQTDANDYPALPREQIIHDNVRSAIIALRPDLAQDCIRGGINAAVEIADEIVRGNAHRQRNVRLLRQNTRERAHKEGQDIDAALAALDREAVEGWRTRLSFQWPTRATALDQFLDTCSARTSAFQVIVAMAMAAAAALAETSLSERYQMHATNAVIMLAVALIYGPFIYTHWKRGAGG